MPDIGSHRWDRSSGTTDGVSHCWERGPGTPEIVFQRWGEGFGTDGEWEIGDGELKIGNWGRTTLHRGRLFRSSPQPRGACRVLLQTAHGLYPFLPPSGWTCGRAEKLWAECAGEAPGSQRRFLGCVWVRAQPASTAGTPSPREERAGRGLGREFPEPRFAL